MLISYVLLRLWWSRVRRFFHAFGLKRRVIDRFGAVVSWENKKSYFFSWTINMGSLCSKLQWSYICFKNEMHLLKWKKSCPLIIYMIWSLLHVSLQDEKVGTKVPLGDKKDMSLLQQLSTGKRIILYAPLIPTPLTWKSDSYFILQTSQFEFSDLWPLISDLT